MSLIKSTARALRDQLAKGEITTADLLDALEARVAEVDGPINALPTLCFDRARKAAASKDSVLAGMPVAIKDLTMVESVRSTYGSPIYENHVPEKSDHIIEQIEGRGGVVYATHRNLARGRPRSTRCLAELITPGTFHDPLQGRPVGRRQLWCRGRLG